MRIIPCPSCHIIVNNFSDREVYLPKDMKIAQVDKTPNPINSIDVDGKKLVQRGPPSKCESRPQTS